MTVAQPDHSFGRDHEIRSTAEAAVRDALRRVRDAGEPLIFGMNVYVEVKPRVTFVVDVLFCFRDAVGVIEIDGPCHRGRWANDRTRDMLIEDNGIGRVFRLPVEGTNDPDELDAFIRSTLRRVVRFY